MQVFAIFDVSNPQKVEIGLMKHYPTNFYRAGDTTFFVATRGETTKQVAENIGFGDDPAPVTGVIVPVVTYWGRHNRELWEWISVKQDTNVAA